MGSFVYRGVLYHITVDYLKILIGQYVTVALWAAEVQVVERFVH